MKKISVTAEPMNVVFQVKPGESLLQAARAAGVDIPASCGGVGSCGKCRITVLSGDGGELEKIEEELFTQEERERGVRLACLSHPRTDLRIWVPEGEGGHFDKKDMNHFPQDFHPGKTVDKPVLSVAPPSLADQRSSACRTLSALEEACGMDGGALQVEPFCLAGLEAAIVEGKGTVTAVLEGNRMLAVEPGDTGKDCFGIAFDIGTTTVVGLLWNLEKGGLLAAAARTNPQTAFGADVISRIFYAGGSEKQRMEMSERIRSCLEEIKEELCREAGVCARRIYRGTVAGNTAMSHLLLGVDASPLARAPFAPVFCRAVDIRAEALGLKVHPAAVVKVLPNIAGHVGSDISALLLVSRMKEKPGVNLAVDIGTNGEILLAAGGRILACSTAAGPAFEGAEIHQGMRAAPGAICGVSIDERGVRLDVVENAAPQGICGSGLIDAVAQMLLAGVVDKSGRMLSREEARERGVPDSVSRRLYSEEGGRGFLLYSGELDGEGPEADVMITQKDIRKVQLAKGAIAAGIRVMEKEAGVEPGQIESVFLAGAFGNFVKRESVLAIGLLPKELKREQVVPIGNAAGAGASMALLSLEEWEKMRRLAAETSHVELSAHPDFQEAFINEMSF